MSAEPALHRNILKHVLRTSGATSIDELLFDPVTALPGLQLLAPQVDQALGDRQGLGILAISIAQFSKLEEVYGWESFDEIVRGFAECLKVIKDECLRRNDAMAELTINGNVFILMLSAPRTRKSISYRDLQRIKSRIAERLDAFIAKTLAPELVFRFRYFIGCSIMRRDGAIRTQRLLYRSIDEALADATSEREKLVKRRARGVKAILQQRRIRTLYQPIVDLASGRAIGYEALSRGPAGEFESPDVLFRVAYESDQVFRLDRLCRERAIRGLSRMHDDQLLFVNIEPLSVFDPDIATRIPRGQASRVVFEITEHAAIADFTTFRQAVQVVKAGGFKLALDDVGSAYSGLRLIAEVEPDFVKLDMELSRGARENRVKQELLRAVARFCSGADLPMIVEGIESEDELETVTGLGVGLAQGFLLGRPQAVPAPASLPALSGAHATM